MKKLIVLAFLLIAACGKPKPHNEIASPFNPTGNYNLSFTEFPGGTCGPLTDIKIGIDSYGTSVQWAQPGWTTIYLNQDCNSIFCTDIAWVTQSVSDKIMQYYVRVSSGITGTVLLIVGPNVCSSDYAVTGTKY